MTASWQIKISSNHPLQRRGHPQMTVPPGDPLGYDIQAPCGHRLKAMCKVATTPADASEKQPRRTAITAANFASEWT